MVLGRDVVAARLQERLGAEPESEEAEQDMAEENHRTGCQFDKAGPLRRPCPVELGTRLNIAGEEEANGDDAVGQPGKQPCNEEDDPGARGARRP